METSLAEVLFRSWACSSLTTLSIQTSDRDARPWPKASFQTFTRLSSFHLTTLAMISVPISDRNLIGVLSCLPNLLDLTIDNSSTMDVNPVTSFLFQTLHAFPSAGGVVSSALVHKLHNLRVKFDEEDGRRRRRRQIDVDFVEMVQSRWIPGGLVDECTYQTATGVDIVCMRSVVLQLVNREVDEEEEVYRPLKYLEKAV